MRNNQSNAVSDVTEGDVEIQPGLGEATDSVASEPGQGGRFLRPNPKREGVNFRKAKHARDFLRLPVKNPVLRPAFRKTEAERDRRILLESSQAYRRSGKASGLS